MSILKTGRPSRKEKAITAVQQTTVNKVVRLNANIPKDLHKRIKQKALDEDKTIKEIIILALNEYARK